MGQKLGFDGQASVFPLSDRFAEMDPIPANDDGGEQVEPDHAVALALARQVEQCCVLARAPDASLRNVSSLRYPFIPAGDVKGGGKGVLKKSRLKPISVGCWATMPGQSVVAEGADD